MKTLDKIREGIPTGNESGMMFKVSIEGLPDMIMVGRSPGDIKGQLRMIVKQPSMITGVKRMPKGLVRQMYRDLAGGKEIDEKTDRWYKDKPEWGTDESAAESCKVTPGQKKFKNYKSKKNSKNQRRRLTQGGTMEILNTVRGWASALADVGVSVAALAIILEVLGMSSMPFMPAGLSVVDNVSAMLAGLGADGVMGLIAIWVLWAIWHLSLIHI